MAEVITEQAPPKQTSSHQQFLENYYRRALDKFKRGEITAEQLANKLAAITQAKERRAGRDTLLLRFLKKDAFSKALEKELQIAERYGLKGALLFLDIDQFKRVNDTLGHNRGDTIINFYGKKITQFTRQIDLRGRFGGDELVVFLVDADIEGAKVVAERIRVGIAEGIKKEFKDVPWDQTISIGMADIKPGDTKEKLMERADEALYEAKKERNKVCVYEEALKT